ncbi:hypothetical protein DFH05DRAFT_238355 [Lentinula detonsa]|uniref:Secreted protein n=1 Tax=Lentinula detonsa TaxID=2804962 RepID=A0A9W8NXC6_9AGAR|nr:hypothetical protein DFH05DRAFT_238355 [Lentinula detonsa]
MIIMIAICLSRAASWSQIVVRCSERGTADSVNALDVSIPFKCTLRFTARWLVSLTSWWLRNSIQTTLGWWLSNLVPWPFSIRRVFHPGFVEVLPRYIIMLTSKSEEPFAPPGGLDQAAQMQVCLPPLSGASS